MNTPPLRREDYPLRKGTAAVVLRGDRFLVIRRSSLVLAPRQFCFPGGGIEGNETESEALVRELQEELRVAARPLRKLWHSLTRWNVDLAWWHTELSEDAVLVPNPDEVESVHWMTAEEMLAESQLLESNRDFLAALAAREILLY